MAGLKRWWIQKYKLPSSHALFQGQSIASLNLEMMEDLWMRERELADEIKNEEGTAQNQAIGQFQEIRKALGIAQEFEKPRVTGDDPLIDQWERDIAAGKVPDLDAQVR